MNAHADRVVVVPLTRVDVTPPVPGWGVVVPQADRVRIVWRPDEAHARRVAARIRRRRTRDLH